MGYYSDHVLVEYLFHLLENQLKLLLRYFKVSDCTHFQTQCEQLNSYSKSICCFKSGSITEANGKVTE